jgi:DNA-binding transcriptional LysR family regulator
MDSRVLKYFLTVAQLGNITKAAEMLHITQPTLSRQLIDLEEEIGGTLFIRGRREVTLTESGVIFQQRASEILSLIEKMENDISQNKEFVSGTVSIGCVESNISQKLSEVISEFHSRYPLVTYDLYGANGDDLKEKLDIGHIDLGIVLEPVETAKYDYIRLSQEEQWGVIIRKDDPLACKDFVTAEELLKLPLILSRRSIVIDEVSKWLGVQRSQLNIFMTHNLLTNSLPLVENSLGVVLCIEGAFQIRPSDNLCFVPLYPQRVSNHVVIWKKNKVLSGATAIFLEFLRDKMQ